MTSSLPLPASIQALVDELAEMPGVIAVVLGGSRAFGNDDANSDWDLGVHYRGALDTTRLAALGPVHAPGQWGRIMNGGAWLTVGDAKVDVLLRDQAFVDEWSDRARDGVFEVDALLGYVAGVPTYSVMAEQAVARVLRGALAPVGPFPERLAEAGAKRWGFSRDFTLTHARMRAERGDAVGTRGQAAKAVFEHAHAVLCARRAWVLNEKQIVERAGLGWAQEVFARAAPAQDLVAWVAEIDRLLRAHAAAEPGAPRT